MDVAIRVCKSDQTAAIWAVFRVIEDHNSGIKSSPSPDANMERVIKRDVVIPWAEDVSASEKESGDGQHQRRNGYYNPDYSLVHWVDRLTELSRKSIPPPREVLL